MTNKRKIQILTLAADVILQPAFKHPFTWPALYEATRRLSSKKTSHVGIHADAYEVISDFRAHFASLIPWNPEDRDTRSLAFLLLAEILRSEEDEQEQARLLARSCPVGFEFCSPEPTEGIYVMLWIYKGYICSDRLQWTNGQREIHNSATDRWEPYPRNTHDRECSNFAFIRAK